MNWRKKQLITAVVFDLDDTLYDCYRQRVLNAHRYACRKMLAAGLREAGGRRPSLEALYRRRLRLFRADHDQLTLDRRLCDQLGLTYSQAKRLARTGQRAYFSFPVGSLRLFRDTLPALKHLSQSGVRVFVITAGKPAIQRAKVKRLGLNGSPLVERVFYTGLLGGRGKKLHLCRLLRAIRDPKRILVVGDRPDSEIRAARELGLWTVRRRGGEFAALEPRNRKERPHHTITRLSQLFSLPYTFSEDPYSHGTR